MGAVIGLAVISVLLLAATLTFMHLLFRERKKNRSLNKYNLSSAAILRKQSDDDMLGPRPVMIAQTQGQFSYAGHTYQDYTRPLRCGPHPFPEA